ncbi:hypothetical protein [Pseudomonas syringae]|uniref:Uncharacterized protein n=1 Tax=Pseudomonas syringae TaxID=317 RepID=A0A085V682_PSESX|nr:hypothetical protein [Pseudomonas syringae]KFE50945.1 hypothetical protein IV02_16145 [Pseudomonas syringae]
MNNSMHKNASSADPKGPDVPHDLPDGDLSEGLTDDERISREDDEGGDGVRVTPGPADKERLPD